MHRVKYEERAAAARDSTKRKAKKIRRVERCQSGVNRSSASARTPSMEEAWQAHIGKLTLQQLHSPEECRTHLDSFARSVVSQGLALTPVANNDDVQDVITTFLRVPEYTMPPAASLKVITDMQREFHVGVMLKEIREIATKAALEGRDRTGSLDPRVELGPDPGTLLESRRSFTADPNWLEKVFSVLRQEGYLVQEELTERRGVNYVSLYKTGAFSIVWNS